jgi:asparagine synthase (glutamine-hydrolysing)
MACSSTLEAALMCGLAGAVFAGEAIRRRLPAALTKLRHRGPDGCHVWSDAKAVLGHARLRILDTSAAADQPMVSADGHEVLVYNGEVYNYRELARALSGWTPGSTSDTDVVLELLRRQGASALARFNGMWALALWQPAERRLVLARDRFGVKPLFFTRLVDEGFAFASEIPALLALAGRRPEPDARALRRFLRFGEAEPRDHTFFAGVEKLPPGCWAELTPGSCRVSRFFDLRTAIDAEPMPADPAHEYASRLDDSVRLRLRSDVPVGTCLSGGLDSSAIVCTVRRAADQGAVEPTLTYNAFSVRHPGSTCDESPFMDVVLEATGFTGRSVVPSPERFAADLTDVVRHQAEPFGSLAVYAQWCVMRLVREHGVTVLLDGQGADEVLAGYPMYGHYRLGDLARTGHLREALRLARSLRCVQGSPMSTSLRSVAAAWAPGVLLQALRGADATRGFVARELSDAREEPSALPGLFADRFTDALFASTTEQGLPSLLRYEDRNSMAFSIEARVPFLDWRLVTLGFRLAPEWKLHDGWTKWVLRQATAGSVPEAIRWRRDKKAFATPQAEWLRGPLRPWVEELLASRELRERGWFDVAALKLAYAAWIAGGPAIDEPLWRVLSAELWARSFAELQPQ